MIIKPNWKNSDLKRSLAPKLITEKNDMYINEGHLLL